MLDHVYPLSSKTLLLQFLCRTLIPLGCNTMILYHQKSQSFILKRTHIIIILEGCTCLPYVNANGFGNCKKKSPTFGNQLTCYVASSSKCSDKKQSKTDPDKWISAKACASPTTTKAPAGVSIFLLKNNEQNIVKVLN